MALYGIAGHLAAIIKTALGEGTELSILNRLRAFIMIVGLQIILAGKEVVTSEGNSLGTVEKVKLDLTQDKVWMVVTNGFQRHWDILIDQIRSLGRQVVLFDKDPVADETTEPRTAASPAADSAIY